MQQHEFIARYEADRPMYEAWGDLVTSTVMSALPGGGEGLIRIPPRPRTKTVDSLVEKAYYRGKGYVDPYGDITDKVGTRFVVLLLDDIEMVCEAIVACSLWGASKDRDFEEERRRQPNLFAYQSKHYVVRALSDLEYGGVSIASGTSCEIQVRTLLQHAVSELTHDTVYKPGVAATPEVQRIVAQSTALIETTDELFKKVDTQLGEANKAIKTWVDASADIFTRVVGRKASANRRVNAYLVDQLMPQLDGVTPDQVEEVVRRFPLDRWLKEKPDNNFLYQQPTIVLVYYLVEKKRYDLRRSWPFPQGELSGAFADLGYSFDD